jgi:hypothetical protein
MFQCERIALPRPLIVGASEMLDVIVKGSAVDL